MFALLGTTVVSPGLGYDAPSPGHVSPSWGAHRHHQQPTTDVRRRVTIYRDSLDTPWGFRLQGGKDFNTPLSVKRVFSGSPAVGQLTRDDLILAINDEPADALFHADVLEKIKSAGNSIVLTIQTSALESEFGYASKDHFRPIQDTRHQQQVNKPKETSQQKSYHAPPAPSHNAAPTTYETPPTTYETPPTTYEPPPPTNETPPTTYVPQPTTYEPPPPTYETPPTTYETSDPSHNRTAANAYNPKNAAHQSRHRSARRFQIAASALPSGLTEPGWTPRPKSVPRNLPLSSAPQPSPAAPSSSQHRSQPALDDHQSVQYPAQRDFWKPEGTAAAAADGSGVPAWYGSLRSTRAAHSWELRAAKVQIQAEEDSSDVAWKEPEQPQLHQAPKQQVQQQQVQQVQPQQAQPEPGRTFKAEIRGLRLARPDYHQTQSTPAWEDAADDRQHHRSQNYTHSAPETPIADAAAVHTETSPSAIYAQQAVESQPSKLQPALLFGGGERNGRGVQQQPSAQQPSAQAQSRVVVRAQPQTTKTAVSAVHTRQEVQVPATKAVAQLVTPATIVPVRQVGSASQANPQVHPTTQLRAQEAVAKPSVQHLIQPSKEQPSITKVSAQPAKLTNLPGTVERFNPGPDRRETTQAQVKHVSVPRSAGKLSETPVERFNPGPDRREATQAQVKHVSAPRIVGKLSETPVERFNPGPDRREATQAQVKHVSAPRIVGKLSETPVERFNPGPDRREATQAQVKHVSAPRIVGKLSETPVERFNPGPDRRETTQAQVKHVSAPRIVGKLSETPVERFNPGPDRREATQAQAQAKHVSATRTAGKLSQTPVERFNPGPDRREATQAQAQAKHVSATRTAGKLSQTPVERFNPGPDRREATQAQVKHVSVPRTVGKLSEAPVERFNPGPDRQTE